MKYNCPMAIPQEFLREGKIRGIVSIRNLKTDEIYLYASAAAVQAYGKERCRLDLGMHPQRQLQNAYTELGLELFIFQLDKEAGEDEDLEKLLQERRNYWKEKGCRLY